MSMSEHIVVVFFETTPENQEEALEKIGAYIDSFLSRQPGFLGSQLHRGLDGTSLVHYARWRSEEDFQAAGVLAREHPDMPALMAYKPSGRGYNVWGTYPTD
jgi:heme-degrading monooxygenase HmoA